MKIGETPIKVFSYSAVASGLATYLCGLLCFLSAIWFSIHPTHDFDFIGLFIIIIMLPIYWGFFYLLAAIGLILSITALFIESNKVFGIVGLLLVFVGTCLFSAPYALSYI